MLKKSLDMLCGCIGKTRLSHRSMIQYRQTWIKRCGCLPPDGVCELWKRILGARLTKTILVRTVYAGDCENALIALAVIGRGGPISSWLKHELAVCEASDTQSRHLT